MNQRKEINLEYIFVCSTSMLHRFLTTSEGLKSWFCDDVVVEGQNYTFLWERESEKASLTEDVANGIIRFEWLDRPNQESTSFEIVRSPITRETILNVQTTCEASFLEEEIIYWNNIIAELKHATGG